MGGNGGKWGKWRKMGGDEGKWGGGWRKMGGNGGKWGGGDGEMAGIAHGTRVVEGCGGMRWRKTGPKWGTKYPIFHGPISRPRSPEGEAPPPSSLCKRPLAALTDGKTGILATHPRSPRRLARTFDQGQTPRNTAHRRCVTPAHPPLPGPISHFPHHLWGKCTLRTARPWGRRRVQHLRRRHAKGHPGAATAQEHRPPSRRSQPRLLAFIGPPLQANPSCVPKSARHPEAPTGTRTVPL